MIKKLWNWLFKRGTKNVGHRLFYSVTGLPENSIESLLRGLQMFREGFFTEKEIIKCKIEFDVVESSDGVLYCFHDATKRKPIKRMVWIASKEFRKNCLYELESELIDMLFLEKTDCKIPRVCEVLHNLQNVKIPIYVEIKKLMTDRAIVKLVDMVAIYKDLNPDSEICFIMFKKKYNKVFDGRKLWFKRLLEKRNLTIKFL